MNTSLLLVLFIFLIGYMLLFKRRGCIEGSRYTRAKDEAEAVEAELVAHQVTGHLEAPPAAPPAPPAAPPAPPPPPASPQVTGHLEAPQVTGHLEAPQVAGHLEAAPPAPPPNTCSNRLESLCGTEKKFPSQDCAKCTGSKQQPLKVAGCTAENVDDFCHGYAYTIPISDSDESGEGCPIINRVANLIDNEKLSKTKSITSKECEIIKYYDSSISTPSTLGVHSVPDKYTDGYICTALAYRMYPSATKHGLDDRKKCKRIWDNTHRKYLSEYCLQKFDKKCSRAKSSSVGRCLNCTSKVAPNKDNVCFEFKDSYCHS